jgi:hypothetical protein
MGASIFQPENFNTPLVDIWQGTSPVKTEPMVLRAISELISSQVLTQQIVTQLASLQASKMAGGRAFLGQNLRADEAAAFDEAEPVRALSQRVQELEKRLDEVAPKKAAATAK